MANTIEEELEEIRNQNPDGLLKPEEVVAYASNPETLLNSKFTWDDGEAAKQWRLEEARAIIRVTVVMVGGEPAPAYVSLHQDRATGGGYRPLTAVMKQADLRAMLLRQAEKDMQTFINRYNSFRRMAGLESIIVAAEKLRDDLKAA